MSGECSRAQTLIQLLLDGRIETEQRQNLDRHLAVCTTCAAALDGYRRLSSIASEWARPTAAEDPGAGFNDRLLKMLEGEAPATHVSVARRGALPILVASILAVACGAWQARNVDLWSSVAAVVAPADWMRGLAQLPDTVHGIVASAWGSLDGLLAGSAALSVPNWAAEAGAAAIAVNAFFLTQALSNRRRQNA